MTTHAAPAASYPGGAQALISVEEVRPLLGLTNVAILDCRLERDYRAGHLPGAMPVDLRGLRHGPLALLPTAPDLAERFGRLGVSNTKRVVLVGDRFTYSPAGYVWWLLHYLGHGNAQVLHGGFEAAVAAALPVTSSRETAAPARFSPTPRPDAAVDTAWVLEHLDDPNIEYVDARGPQEFALGHIARTPIANLSHDLVFDQETGALKRPDELRALFQGLQRANVVIYCHSGVRSATVGWALAAMGRSAANYNESMQVWEARRLPTAVPAP